MIDNKLYSRQIYAIGEDTMKKIIGSTCIISGMTGVGIEIAKIIALSGVKKIILHDKLDICDGINLCNNYFCRNTMTVNKSYCKTLIDKIKKINANTKIKFTQILNYDTIKLANVLIMCDWNVFECIPYNNFCRENNVKFILVKSNGLIGMMFSDYGNAYKYINDNGEPYKTGAILSISENVVTTCDPHNMYNGDKITFSFNKKCIHDIKVISRNKFSVNANTIECKNIDQHIFFTEHKDKKRIRFRSLIDNILRPQYANNDAQHLIHYVMIGIDLWKLINHNAKYPVHSNESIYMEICKCIQLISKLKHEDIATDSVKKIVYTHRGNLCPINSIIGGMCGQEIINVIGNKFTPNHQLMYIDFSYILPSNYLAIDQSEFIVKHDEYDAQRLIFGNNYINLLKNIKPLIIGAGAIGCEYAKMTSMMGIDQQYIVDNDSIERSNLSRQFLFENNDIGKSKAIIVNEKINQINADVKITPMVGKFSLKSNMFGATLMDKVDLLLGGVDNIETRLEIDMFATLFGKPYIDAGTMGTKGNIQSIMPKLTEQYSALRDYVDENIPLCTIKMFPYKYEHVVSYALDVFVEYFGKEDILTVISDMNIDDIKKYSIDIFNKLFFEDIQDIINKYPHDHIGEDGELFWTGSKYFPKLIQYDAINSAHNEVIDNFVNGFLHIKNTKDKPIDFDKENDVHINILTSIAHTRADIYNIPKENELSTKKIAGKIIPALNTTTTIVAGYVGIEIYKLVYWLNREIFDTNQCFKTGSFNTAIQMYSFSDAMESKSYSIDGNTWSSWHTLNIDENETPHAIFNRYLNGLNIKYSNMESIVMYPDFIMCPHKGIVVNNDSSDTNFNSKFLSIVDKEYPFIFVNFGDDSRDVDNNSFQLTCKITNKITK